MKIELQSKEISLKRRAAPSIGPVLNCCIMGLSPTVTTGDAAGYGTVQGAKRWQSGSSKSVGAVVLTLPFDDDSGLGKAVEHLAMHKIISEFGVAAPEVAILLEWLIRASPLPTRLACDCASNLFHSDCLPGFAT